MSAVAERVVYTPEDLLTMPGAERCELVNGELVEKDMGLLTSIVAERLSRRLGVYVEDNALGWTPSSECGYQYFRDAPLKVRKPDASFISRERLPEDRLHEGHVGIPPDLAVEVVSPNDVFSKVVVKAQEYLDAGVRLVWLVEPVTRSVQVFRADGSVSRLLSGDQLTGEAVVPGFSVLVDELFPAAGPVSSDV